MKKAFLFSAFLGLAAIALSGQANARPGGCLKDAIVGGIAGHFVGHGGVGAAAGCAYGIHRRHEYDRQEGRSSYERHGGDGQRY